MNLEFKSNTPCNNCPYRKDAPLRLWDKSEYEKLQRTEQDHWGSVYGCHKQNESVCVGWLMNQEKRNFPSLALRLKMMKQNISRAWLDTLHCASEMYNSVKEMIEANYPMVMRKHNTKEFKLKKLAPRGLSCVSPERRSEIAKKGNAARQETLARRKK